MNIIGFIGLGNMGGNMAARYLAAGYQILPALAPELRPHPVTSLPG